MLQTKSRNISMDIIRCTALLLVISVHFFLNSGFYDKPLAGGRMYLMTLMRSTFMICVPLFLLLSGYLMSGKKLNKRYYFGLGKTVGIYLLASIACLVYRTVFLHEPFTWGDSFYSLLNFSAAPYAWYIEMYLGLFLLIPFLNAAYHGLSSKKQKQVLLLTMVILTAAPAICNLYKKILPAWWTSLYPVAYYFIGCYLKEFRPKIKKSVGILLLAGIWLLSGTFNFFISQGGVFIWGAWTEYGALPNAIAATLLFLLLENRNTEACPPTLRKLLKWMSNACLGAYLVSYSFDSYFYTILNQSVPDMQKRLNYFPLIIPLVFLCSLLLSAGLNLIFHLLQTAGNQLRRLGSKRRLNRPEPDDIRKK